MLSEKWGFTSVSWTIVSSSKGFRKLQLHGTTSDGSVWEVVFEI